jgi:hypothetical protein
VPLAFAGITPFHREREGGGGELFERISEGHLGVSMIRHKVIGDGVFARKHGAREKNGTF